MRVRLALFCCMLDLALKLHQRNCLCEIYLSILKSKGFTMKRITFCIAMVFSLASWNAFSEQGSDTTKKFDLAWLKAKCVELTANEQLKPFSAIISCSSKSTFWKQVSDEPPQMFKMVNTQVYGVAAKMKGFQLPYREIAETLPPTEAPCVVMEKWTRTVPEIETKKSCEEIMAVNSVFDL